LLGALAACVLFAFRPTWLIGGLLATLVLAALALKIASRLTAWQQLRHNPCPARRRAWDAAFRLLLGRESSPGQVLARPTWPSLSSAVRNFSSWSGGVA
jgi:hypothetical protein